jgi:hypothetical protein
VTIAKRPLWRRDAESKVQIYEKRKQNIFARGECHFAIETIREISIFRKRMVAIP